MANALPKTAWRSSTENERSTLCCQLTSVALKVQDMTFPIANLSVALHAARDFIHGRAEEMAST